MDLLNCLNENRNKRREETVQGIDFTHASRKAWKTFSHLSGRKTNVKQCPVTANSIAKQLLDNSRYDNVDKEHDRKVKQQCSTIWRTPGADGHMSTFFSTSELKTAVKQLKSEKAQGPDNILPEFLMHCGTKCLQWMSVLFQLPSV